MALTSVFLVVDLAFFGANMVKFVEGGWFPLAAASVIYLLMSTWRRGRQLVTSILTETSLPLDLFIPDIAKRKPPRVPGVAVFMTSIHDVAPPVLLHHLKHNKMLHEKVLLMTLSSQEIPQVAAADRVTAEARGSGLYPGARPLRIHGIAERAGDPRGHRQSASTNRARRRRRSS